MALAVAVAGGFTAAWFTRSTVDRSADVESRATQSMPPVMTRAASDTDASVLTVRAIDSGQQVPSNPTLVRDPRSPDYDAARLFEMRMDGAREVFEAEPRDEVWAKQRESDIVALTLRDFQQVDPDARLDVECRTGTCRVRIHSRKPYLIAELANYPLACLARHSQPWWGDPDTDDPATEIYLVFDGATRTREGLAERESSLCARYREDWLREAPKP